jgi:hypothetical protein
VKEQLREWFPYLRFRVGGQETTVDINRTLKKEVGVTFEVPRQSLMAAVRYLFDDLMIGNFMRTTLHGSRDRTYLNRTFTPVVAKYADSGGTETREELHQYLHHYYAKDPVGYAFMHLEKVLGGDIPESVRDDSIIHRAAKRIYWSVKG